jgi:hypothetical protein
MFDFRRTQFGSTALAKERVERKLAVILTGM